MNKLELILKCMLLLVVAALIVPSATAITFDWYSLTDYRAGEVSEHDTGFYLQATLVKDGKIKILFPEGFDISAATNITDPQNNWALDDGTYTFIRDVPSRTLIFQRNGDGDDYPADVRVDFTLGNIVNPKKGNYVITIYTTLSNDLPTPDLGSESVSIDAGPATHFKFDEIADPQVAGTAFPITVNALDKFGDVAGDNFVASLSSGIGTITPDWINIIAGTGTTDVLITKIDIDPGTGNITATAGTIKGASNEFTVKPATLGSIVIATIPNQYDEQAFTVTAQAKDTEGNNKTDYNAVNNLTVNPGVPGTVTIVSPSPATVQFVNGKFSGQVTLNVDPDPTPTALQTGVSLTITNTTVVPPIIGTSNDFSISLPVDLKNSTVVAVPTKVIEDGISTSTITVTVKNGISQGNISGASVVLTSTRGALDTIVPASNTTNSNGQATFRVRSSTPGTAKLTATVWDTEVLEQKPVVTFGFDGLLHLAKGWNLVSVPRKLNDNSLSALATDKVNKIYYYDTANDEWKFAIYTSGTWNGTLTTIDDGKGYWMNATASTNVQAVLKPFDPLQPPPDYPLKAGWNLIGYTSYRENPYLYTDIYTYLNSLRYPVFPAPIWESAYRWIGSGYEQAKSDGSGDFEDVVRTEGYWLYLKDDGVLVP